MIYFIQDTRTLEIKIGYTSADSADGRIAALQTGNPGALRLLSTAQGDRSREAELHRQFADDRTNGEWFRPTPELLAFLLEEARDDGTRAGFRVGKVTTLEVMEATQEEPKHPDFRWVREDRESGDRLAKDQVRRAFDIYCPHCGQVSRFDGKPEELTGTESRDINWDGDHFWEGRDDGLVILMRCYGCQKRWRLCIAEYVLFALAGRESEQFQRMTPEQVEALNERYGHKLAAVVG